MKTITFFKRVLASAALVSVCGFALQPTMENSLSITIRWKEESWFAVKYMQ